LVAVAAVPATTRRRLRNCHAGNAIANGVDVAPRNSTRPIVVAQVPHVPRTPSTASVSCASVV